MSMSSPSLSSKTDLPRPTMKEATAIAHLLDRYYLFAATGVSALVIHLNYYARTMQEGLLPRYQQFARLISAGFDALAAGGQAPTFPMWGYGWLFVVTENRLGLLVVQSVLALFAVWFLIRHVERQHLLGTQATRALKLLVICSLPWYAFHALRWPYSINVSLTLISLVLFHRAVVSERIETRTLILSGVLFGAALNFRSDYSLLPLGLATAMCCVCRPVSRVLGKMTIWLVSIYFALIPWMLYTWHVAGRPLLMSTNGGHVLFIGLGTLPDNKWGITISDTDPEMLRALREHFGRPEDSMSFAGDQFLKHEFLHRIRSDLRSREGAPPPP